MIVATMAGAEAQVEGAWQELDKLSVVDKEHSTNEQEDARYVAHREKWAWGLCPAVHQRPPKSACPALSQA